MKTDHLVDFVVSGLDEQGHASGCLLEAKEVVVLDDHGKARGTFRDAETLIHFLLDSEPSLRGEVKLVATKTSKEPRADLVGRFRCDARAGSAI
jgi:hypothetical protein